MSRNIKSGHHDRIERTFSSLKDKGEAAFIPFVVLGDPNPASTVSIIQALEPHSDIIEVGIPFSDPMADGPTIQNANQRSFAAGMNTEKAFELMGEIRKFTDKPIVILTYFNLLLNYTGNAETGVRAFFDAMERVGVDGIIIADLPIEEINLVWADATRTGRHIIFLVSPATTPARFEKIQDRASGYLYLIALMGVTGARVNLSEMTFSALQRVRDQKRIPVAVGFGISTPDHVREIISAGADGAIVGSAIVKIIEANQANPDAMLQQLAEYAKDMKAATRREQ